MPKSWLHQQNQLTPSQTDHLLPTKENKREDKTPITGMKEGISLALNVEIKAKASIRKPRRMSS